MTPPEEASVVPPTTTRVFLVDDHELIRRGLGLSLEAEPDLEVVGEAGSAVEALAKIPFVDVDVVVLDVRLPDADGLDLCREIRARSPNLKVIMLTSLLQESVRLESMSAGAMGYLLKQTTADEIVATLRQLGKEARPSEVTRTDAPSLGASLNGLEEDPLARLTAQERRVFDLIGEGLTNREIGTRLNLSERTIKNYASSVLAKLGMRSRTAVAVFAARRAADRTVPGT